MEHDRSRHVTWWILPAALAFTILWLAWWGYRLLVGGGLDAPGDVLWLAISGVTCAVLLGLGWQTRRELRRQG